MVSGRGTGGRRGTRRQPLALVADDEPLVRRLVASVLARLGWRVVEASNGAVALAMVLDDAVDLLVTDHQMPVVNGEQLAGILRHRFPHVSIVMISGHAAGAEVAAAHGYHFLSKPFSLEELSSLLQAVRGEGTTRLSRRLGLPRSNSETSATAEAAVHE